MYKVTELHYFSNLELSLLSGIKPRIFGVSSLKYSFALNCRQFKCLIFRFKHISIHNLVVSVEVHTVSQPG